MKNLQQLLLILIASGCTTTTDITIVRHGTELEGCQELEPVYVTGKSQYWADKNAEKAVDRQGGDTLLLNAFQEIWVDTLTQSVTGVAYRCGTN